MTINGKNIDPADLVKFVQETISELGGEEGLKELEYKRKGELIEDIIRVHKNSVIFSEESRRAMQDVCTTIDKLCDCDLDILDAYLSALSKKWVEYVRGEALKHNNGYIKPPEQDDFWKPYDNNFK